MNKTLATLLAVGSIATFACVTSAYAGGRTSIRADLPYPYGPAGMPSSDEWSLAGSPTLTAFAGVAENFNYELDSGAGITNDDFEFNNPVLGSQSIQDVGYVAAVPTAPYSDSPPSTDASPLTQILEYSLAGGGHEFQFNYDSSLSMSTVGTATLKFGGVTFTSVGTTLPLAGADNDNFVFDAAGTFIGSNILDSNGNNLGLVLGGCAPTGWTSSAPSCTTTTTTAPEIDPSSATAALTLLAGGLLVMRGGRRTLKVIR